MSDLLIFFTGGINSLICQKGSQVCIKIWLKLSQGKYQNGVADMNYTTNYSRQGCLKGCKIYKSFSKSYTRTLWWRDMVPRDNLPRDNVPRDNVPRDNVPQDNPPRDNLPQRQSALGDNMPWAQPAPRQDASKTMCPRDNPPWR